MSLFSVFDIAGGAMTAQSKRLNVVASNLANADSASSSTGKPYHARQVIFEAKPLPGNMDKTATSVQVAKIIDDPSPMRQMYDPKHPSANEQGYVTMPNVDVVEEMVNMISASRSYQSNVDMINTAKSMLLKTLTLGQ